MESLKSVIGEVTSFPELYLGKPSLERLYAFIGGFLYLNSEADDHCLDGFNEYVAAKYGIKTTHNWSSIISFFSSTEQEAFDNFKKIFSEYVSSQLGDKERQGTVLRLDSPR